MATPMEVDNSEFENDVETGDIKTSSPRDSPEKKEEPPSDYPGEDIPDKAGLHPNDGTVKKEKLKVPPAPEDYKDVLELLRHFMHTKYTAGNQETVDRDNQVMKKCEELFAKDYDFYTIDNSNGALCHHYPPKLLFLCGDKPKKSQKEELQSVNGDQEEKMKNGDGSDDTKEDSGTEAGDVAGNRRENYQDSQRTDDSHEEVIFDNTKGKESARISFQNSGSKDQEIGGKEEPNDENKENVLVIEDDKHKAKSDYTEDRNGKNEVNEIESCEVEKADGEKKHDSEEIEPSEVEKADGEKKHDSEDKQNLSEDNSVEETKADMEQSVKIADAACNAAEGEVWYMLEKNQKNKRNKTISGSEEPEDVNKEDVDIVEYEKQEKLERLRALLDCARLARCRGRFPMPVIRYGSRSICRSATISTGVELYSRYYRRWGKNETALRACTDVLDEDTEKGSVWHDVFRKVDIDLLTALDIGYIVDLMVENKKVKYHFVTVSSSEKVDKHGRYKNFGILSMPYPGCEHFTKLDEQTLRSASKLGKGSFNWSEPYIDAKLEWRKPAEGGQVEKVEPPANVDWDSYKSWPLTELTQNYLAAMLHYLDHADSGLLVHCISGWDRTPLFVSLLRLSLWADGQAHTSLNAQEILYLTVAYDWYLFGHELPDRRAKRQIVFFFCFKFLEFITDHRFSLGGREPQEAKPAKTPVERDILERIKNSAALTQPISLKSEASDEPAAVMRKETEDMIKYIDMVDMDEHDENDWTVAINEKKSEVLGENDDEGGVVNGEEEKGQEARIVFFDENGEEIPAVKEGNTEEGIPVTANTKNEKSTDQFPAKETLNVPNAPKSLPELKVSPVKDKDAEQEVGQPKELHLLQSGEHKKSPNKQDLSFDHSFELVEADKDEIFMKVTHERKDQPSCEPYSVGGLEYNFCELEETNEPESERKMRLDEVRKMFIAAYHIAEYEQNENEAKQTYTVKAIQGFKKAAYSLLNIIS